MQIPVNTNKNIFKDTELDEKIEKNLTVYLFFSREIVTKDQGFRHTYEEIIFLTKLLTRNYWRTPQVV